MQTQLIKSLKPQKERVAKDNGSYYLLKKTSVPIMIIECAFMSNPTEAALLVQENYQEKVAWESCNSSIPEKFPHKVFIKLSTCATMIVIK